MDALIVLSVIGAILCYLAYTGRGERARQRNLETTRRQVRHLLDIIYEKNDIAKSVTDIATRKNEIDEAIQTTNCLENSSPDYANYSSLLEELEETKILVYTGVITSKVSYLIRKSRHSVSTDKKIECASSAIFEIENGLRDAHVNKAVLKKRKEAIEAYIDKVKIEELRQNAERHEFKKEYAKAVDSYLDMLFLLNRKNNDGAIQSEKINNISVKIEALRKNITSV